MCAWCENNSAHGKIFPGGLRPPEARLRIFSLHMGGRAGLTVTMQKDTFEDRFLSKLSKIDKQEIESFLSHLVREKHFLEIVFNALVDGVLVLRPDLTVIYANNAAIDLLGINPRRKIVGERVAGLVPIPEFGDLVARFAIQRERITNAEVESRGMPPRPLQVTIIPLEADQDRQSGSAIVIVHDATEARQAAEEHRRAERASTLSLLAAGLAHEIKNPLNSLQIHAQLLQRALREATQDGRGRGGLRAGKIDLKRVQQSTEIIVEEIRRLSGVVDQFLTATRPTRPLFQRANVNRLVEHVVETLRPEADARGVQLRLALDHDMPNVDLDPNQMTQAILNLVKNSLEALTPDGSGSVGMNTGGPRSETGEQVITRQEDSVPPFIEVRTETADGSYRIRVTDDGPGIIPENLKRIFEPYFTTKVTGTGLGLAIVSRIVEDHSGTMDIRSAPGRGTSVTLTFPLDTRHVRLLE